MNPLARLIALMSDPRTPKLPRLMVVAAALYALWPIDLVPEIAMPLFGLLDDLTLLWLSSRWLFKSDPSKEPGTPPPGPPTSLPPAPRQ